jgi:hypothetical protein
VTGSPYRLFAILTLSALAGGAAWKFLPGTLLDRQAFQTVACGFYNPPFLISGNGSPWTLQAAAGARKTKPKAAPLVVSLEDDPKGFFQSSPPAPVDLAVIFNNFLRLGKSQVACAAMLSWESPDPIGLGALEKVMGRFDSLVMAAPVSRGAVPGAMPPAFRRGSISLAQVQGDPTNLPLVNRIPIPGLVLGSENAMAGFSVLESETPTTRPHLLARWDDRVLFSFSLLTVLQQQKIPISDVEIQLGQSIRLGKKGILIPIDAYGRFTQPLKNSPAAAALSAEALIDIAPAAVPPHAPGPLILRDDQSAAEPSTREFSGNLLKQLTALGSDSGLAAARAFSRLPELMEIGMLVAGLLIVLLLSRTSNDLRSLFVILGVGVLLTAQWLAFAGFSLWLPGLPMLAIFLCGWIFAYTRPKKILILPAPVASPTPPPARKTKKNPQKKRGPRSK